MLAIKHTVSSFLPFFPNSKHLRIMTDNSTSVSYISKQRGTHSPMCNKLTVKVWGICIQHLSHLSAAHIPGKHNVLADLASRKFQDSAEWMISRSMSVSWHSQYVYIFSPFSMIWPALKKSAERMSKNIDHSTQMDYTTVVPSSPPASSSTTQRDKQHTTSTSENEEDPPPQPQGQASSSSMLQRHQRAKEFSEQATNILSAAWRKNTKSKDEGAIKSYVSFCHEREADPYNSNDTIVIEFLTQEFERGMSSSAINGMITVIKKIKNS